MDDMDFREISAQHLKKIRDIAKEIRRKVTLMEVCGGHTNTIMRYGIRGLLPENIRLISGPGCPICVSDQRDIDSVVELALSGIPIATYGDMLRVPGSRYSLEEAKAKGGEIYEVYSAVEVLDLKKKNPDIVFFGVGFETTAPMTAYLLEKEVCVYSAHKLVPPAMEALVSGEVGIDGFISPGHVSTVIGIKPYKRIKVPQVISGFTAEQVLRSISILLQLIRDGKKDVVNGYPEAVHSGGNKIAQKKLRENFRVVDSVWRGLGLIPESGFEVKRDELNAKTKYKSIIERIPSPRKTACRCGEILRGVAEPRQCPLYAKKCTPETPKGACMVSPEGTCSISYKYGR